MPRAALISNKARLGTSDQQQSLDHTLNEDKPQGIPPSTDLESEGFEASPTAERHSDSTEMKMRQALGLENRQAARDKTPSVPTGRLSLRPHSSDDPPWRRSSRRFVQDGEVPVTVVRGRWPHTSGADEPVANRVAVAEAALDSERLQRERIERSLQNALDTVRDLQTKQAHIELARDEAVQALKRNAEALDSLHAALRSHQEQLAAMRTAVGTGDRALRESMAALTAERTARIEAESALQEAAGARKPRRIKTQAGRQVPAKPARRIASGSPIGGRKAKLSSKATGTRKAIQDKAVVPAKAKLTRSAVSKKVRTGARKTAPRVGKRRRLK